MEVFHNMWFAPISERKQGRGAEHHLLVTKVCAKDVFVVFFYAVFRIQTGSGLNQVSGSGFGIWIPDPGGRK
jgi:hypothetical protein